MRPLPDGYEIRSPSFEDVERVAEVLLADDLAETGESEFDTDFVRDQWSKPGVELSEDAWVVTDPNGTIVAHTNLSPDGEGKLKSIASVVHPEHRGRGIGSALLDRLEARASDRLRGIPAGILHTAVNVSDPAAAALVRSRGFEHVRTFRHLQIDLDGSPGDPGDSPAGIEIRGIEPECDLRRIHAIFVEAFSQEWGYRVIPFEEWVGLEVETASYDPSLWLLATDGDEAVGALGRRVGPPGLGRRARRAAALARPRDRVGAAKARVRHVRVPRAGSRDAERRFGELDRSGSPLRRRRDAHLPRVGRVREARGLTHAASPERHRNAIVSHIDRAICP